MPNLIKAAKDTVANYIPVKPRRIPFGPAKGLVMNVDFNLDTAFYLGFYEKELNEHYRALIKPGMRCFDVGSNRGWDTLIFYGLNGGADVLAFDCDPVNPVVSEANTALNGFQPKTVIAYVSSATDDRGYISLDDAADQHFVPDFIKMDIEGAEADTLEGAAKLLTKRKPSLVIEVHGKAVEDRCRTTLAKFGYSPITVDQRPAMILKEKRGTDLNRWLICEGHSS